MKRAVTILAAAFLFGSGLGLGAINLGAASPITTSVALTTGNSATVSCSGTKLTANKVSKVQYSLACTGATPVTTTTLPTTTDPPTTIPTTTTVPVTTTTTPVTPGSWWVPGTGPIEWQWILSRPLTTTDIQPGITVYDIDGFDNSAQTVAAIHAAGDRAICYIDVGTSENFRPDFSSFPAALEGKTNGWPGEKWLNTSPSGPDYSTLQAIMTARFQMCAAKGFDAVEPDNIDGAENSTGFPLTNADSIAYAKWFASEVHSLGMGVAQKNYVDQSQILQPYFDFVIDEQCAQYSECNGLAPYSVAGKAILEAEYSGGSSFCAAANAANRDAVLFDLALDGRVRLPCR